MAPRARRNTEGLTRVAADFLPSQTAYNLLEFPNGSGKGEV